MFDACVFVSLWQKFLKLIATMGLSVHFMSFFHATTDMLFVFIPKEIHGK